VTEANPAAPPRPTFLERLRTIELRIAAGALLVMTFMTVADVFMRYAFNRPIRGSYDTVEAMLVVFVFHGVAVGFLGRKNIVIDVLDIFAGPKVLAVLVRFADLVSIACLLVLFYAMITPAMQAWQYGDTKIDLGLPTIVLWLVALSGMAMAIVFAIAAAFTRPDVDKRPH
jgi:TRAP-type C4-dicarboxylate transport system permease small subunit